MNIIKLHFFTFLFFCFYCRSSIFAQVNNESVYPLAVQNVISIYTKTLDENTRLYNGPEYIESHPDVSGSPFWKTDTLQEGSVYYDSVFYPNIFLAYDAVKEEVAIKNKQRLSIKLLTEKINSFTLSNQLFVNITSDSANNYGFKSGFYNILYDDVVTVLAKRKKVALRVLTPTDHYEFREQSFYFIKNNGRYYTVDTKDELLAALHDKKDEVKKFLQKNKFDFKKNFEETLIKTGDYYSQLKK